ncbi:methyl-accepting chemotaxis protein [Litchfieldia salsa]|uniref:Methyl-accepting chemotaxis protein n=1 Tax=Litchfieldia salsa TaxID=930152 RepID=A0A1H0PV35_9BACI|nr:HAMP domain-containing methyl-accepting chemotaxis protein [Litchfieldia salsa]SDP08992.1 methyl-accepting chemotaxis protein [Litchfieldia salsa]
MKIGSKFTFFKNLSVFKKIVIILVISALGLGLVGMEGITSVNKIAKGEEIIYEEQLIPNQLFGELRSLDAKLDIYSLEILLSESAQKEEVLGKLIATAEEVDKLQGEIDRLRLHPNIQEKYEMYKQKNSKIGEVAKKMIGLSFENKNGEAFTSYLEEVKPLRDEVNNALTDIQALNAENAEFIYKADKTIAKKTSVFLTTIMILSLLVSLLVGIVVARSIVQPIRQLQGFLSEVENGDFTVEGTYKSKDEVGKLTSSFNSMIGGVRSIIKTMSETSEQLAASSQELSASAEESTRASEHISSTIQELSDGSKNQLQSVDNSNLVIVDMSTSTERISKSTDHVLTNAQETSHLSKEGKESINKVSTQMKSINQTVTSLVEAFKGLKERTDEIGNITSVITGIADQTNLLALNAAIEAARAGEQGKGFAVVAGEVRKLAEQSAQSADQISKLIKVIQVDTQQTMNTVTSASSEVNEGLVVVQDAGTIFNNIEGSITEVVTQIDEVANLVNSLASGMGQVTQSINGVKEIADETAASSESISSATEEQLASMEEIASSAQVLAKNAETLQLLISNFKV